MVGMILLVIASIAFFYAIRNHMVFNERQRILKKVSERADHDIANDHPWSWRYAAYNSVSYNGMLCKFWKPVKSFYKNHSCLN